MGETLPPASKEQRAHARGVDDPHESVTIAPPAPSVDDILAEHATAPSLSSRSDQHFRAALEAGSRAGSSLTALARLVNDLAGGLTGARLANEQLVQELSTLRALLGSAKDQQVSLTERVAELEQALAEQEQEAARQRQFLTDQHDDFLAALMEEHEQALADHDAETQTTRISAEVSELARSLARAEAARSQAESDCQRARDALAKAQTQRDEAQARADKRERERDELRAEASQLRARLGAQRPFSTAPPPPVASRPASYRPPPELALDTGELDSTLPVRAPTPRVANVVPRFMPPRAPRVGAALTPSPPSPTAEESAPAAVGPSALEFPRESTRPGVGGPKPSEPPPPPSFGPSPSSGWTPVPPAPDSSLSPRPAVVSAASQPPGLAALRPALKQKPDPTTRPLTDYSLGEDGVSTETLEGVRLSSKPPRK
jgi:hypothetical protein